MDEVCWATMSQEEKILLKLEHMLRAILPKCVQCTISIRQYVSSMDLCTMQQQASDMPSGVLQYLKLESDKIPLTDMHGYACSGNCGTQFSKEHILHKEPIFY